MPECLIPIMYRITGTQLQRLAKSSYKVETRAAGMLYIHKINYSFHVLFFVVVIIRVPSVIIPFIFALGMCDDIY